MTYVSANSRLGSTFRLAGTEFAQASAGLGNVSLQTAGSGHVWTEFPQALVEVGFSALCFGWQGVGQASVRSDILFWLAFWTEFSQLVMSGSKFCSGWRLY